MFLSDEKMKKLLCYVRLVDTFANYPASSRFETWSTDWLDRHLYEIHNLLNEYFQNKKDESEL